MLCGELSRKTGRFSVADPPLLAARKSEHQAEPTHRRETVGGMRVATGQPRIGRAPGCVPAQTPRPSTTPLALPLLSNQPVTAHAFGVVRPKPRCRPKALSNPSRKALRRQSRWPDPVVRGQQRGDVDREERAHRRGAAQHVTARGTPASPDGSVIAVLLAAPFVSCDDHCWASVQPRHIGTRHLGERRRKPRPRVWRG